MRHSAKAANSAKRTAQSFQLLALSFALCAAVRGSAQAFNAHQPFDISSDVLDYNDETQEITAQGHVVIVQSSSTLQADVVRYDRLHQHLIARGQVILREKDAILLGDQMDYDLDQEKGVVLGGKGYGSPWLFQGAAWEKNQDYYVGRNASFTSCDLIDPHYHIKSSRVHLIPDRLFWAWNNVFYVGDKPVMYSPFMYKNLGEQHIVFQAQPGSDSLLGAFAKTTTTMRFTDRVYDKLYLDHYTVAGNGYGDELNFNQPNRYKGSFLGYYIDPHPAAVLRGAPLGPQYSFRGALWAELSKKVHLQVNTNLMRNVSFNTQYFTQNPNQSQNDLLSSIALTHQTTSYSQNLSVQREDAPDPTDTGAFATTHLQNASYPQYNFTLFDRPLWSPKRAVSTPAASAYGPLSPGATSAVQAPALRLTPPSKVGPILFGFTGAAQNQFLRADNRIHSNAQSGFHVTESFPFARDWTYNIAVAPQINFQDKGPTSGASTDTQKGYTGSNTFTNGLRWRPLSFVTIDTGHTLTERLKPNALEFARDSTDHGVTANIMSLSLNVRPNPKLLIRSSSGFDFRRLDDENPNVYNQRKWSPWSSDLTYDPNRRWEYYLSEQFGHYPFRTLFWQASVRYRGIHKTLVSSGFVYNSSSPGEVTWNQTVGYYFGPGWRVDASMNALVPSTSLSATRDANLINTQLIVVRDMHCWQAKFIYNDTPPFSRSYSVLFDLKLGGAPAKPIADQDFESQFYPWRNRDSDPTIR